MGGSRWQTTAQLLRDRPHVRLVPPQPGQGGVPMPAPVAATPRVPPPALQALFRAIQDAAETHGWEGHFTYNPHGPDSGLHVILVRESVLYAEVCLEGAGLSPGQQTWISALQGARQEVMVWTPQDIPQIQKRLGRARRVP